MVPRKRNPPGGHRRVSGSSVVAGGSDFPKDSSTDPEKQISVIPPGFDPKRSPILAIHWLGLAPATQPIDKEVLNTTKVIERSERELLKAWLEQLEARP